MKTKQQSPVQDLDQYLVQLTKKQKTGRTHVEESLVFLYQKLKGEGWQVHGPEQKQRGREQKVHKVIHGSARSLYAKNAISFVWSSLEDGIAIYLHTHLYFDETINTIKETPTGYRGIWVILQRIDTRAIVPARELRISSRQFLRRSNEPLLLLLGRVVDMARYSMLEIKTPALKKAKLEKNRDTISGIGTSHPCRVVWQSRTKAMPFFDIERALERKLPSVAQWLEYKEWYESTGRKSDVTPISKIRLHSAGSR